MENNGYICQIQPQGTAIPIEARFIRGWRPYRTGNTYCHLIVDQKGDAIQVFSEDNSKDSVCATVKMMHCYRLKDYVCSRATATMKVAPHSASLRVGKASSITPIKDNNQIPTTYFNFISYQGLLSRIDNHQILTDFIGKIDDAWNEKTDNDTIVMRLKIQASSGEQVEITLWPEIARLVDVDAISRIDHHVIAAVTSLKVSDFRGKTKLQSTSATHVYIDPHIDIARSIANTFEEREGPKTPSNTLTRPLTIIESPSQRNRTTIAALLQQNPYDIAGIPFTCNGSITSFTNNRAWYYTACQHCNKGIERQAEGYRCINHGVMKPKYCYCVTATLADESGNTSVTIFDQAITSIIGISCYDMVVQHGYTDPTIIPEPLQLIRGQNKIFRVERTTGTSAFKINRAFNIQDVTSTPPTTAPTKRQLFQLPGYDLDKDVEDSKRQKPPD